MRRPPSRVDAFEIRIDANGGHRRQNFGEAAPTGMPERRREDGAMFGFRTATVRPGALLESPDEFFIDSAHE
jgi:hypothetical protein